MSLQNIASTNPSQVGADRFARTNSHETATVPFAAIPHALLADRKLKPIDILLIGAILKFARAKANCWPSVGTLANEINRSVRTVQYSLRRLINNGWIATRPDSNQTGRIIVLLWKEIVCTPPVQKPYSQGIPRVQSAAPKTKKEIQKEVTAPASIRKEPEKPMTHSELLEMFTASGRFDLPEGHALRRSADQLLAKALEAAKNAPENVVSVLATPVPGVSRT